MLFLTLKAKRLNDTLPREKVVYVRFLSDLVSQNKAFFANE